MPYVFQTEDKSGEPHPRWKFQYTDWKGRRRSATGTTSKAETEKLAHHVQADQDAIRKGWRPPPKTSDTPRVFDEVMAEYLAWGESQGGRGGRPWAPGHLRMRRSYLGWWKKQLSLEVVSDLVGSLPRVEKALRDHEALGRAPKTLANTSESIKAFCDWCSDRGYLDGNPLSGLSPFDTTPRSRRRAMSVEEIGRLLEACSPKRRLCYEVAFTSGLRAGEIKALQVRHLDTVQGGVKLDQAWTKNRKAGFQPLPTWLVDELRESGAGKEPGDPLLYVPSHPARDLEEDLVSAGIPKQSSEGKLDFHACRVAYVSWVVEAGASIKEAQSLARHQTPGLTLNTYARARNERLAEVVEAVGRTLRPTSTTEAQRAADQVASASALSRYGNGRSGSTPAASTRKALRENSFDSDFPCPLAFLHGFAS